MEHHQSDARSSIAEGKLLPWDRLAGAEAGRQAEAGRRRAALREQSDPQESSSAFHAQFLERKRSIEEKLESVLPPPVGLDPPHVAPPVASGGDGNATPGVALASVAADLEALEQSFVEAAYYLPAYDLKSAQREVAELRAKLKAAEDVYAPRKGFAFGARRAKPKGPKHERPLVENGREIHRQSDAADGPSHARQPEGGGALPSSSSDLPEAPGGGNAAVRGAAPGLRHEEGGTHVLSAGDVPAGGEFMLQGLVDCTVHITAPLQALFIDDLVRCHVFAGPVSGAVHIERVSDSTLMLASHQVRIHGTARTDFYLRVRSEPVVEDVNSVRFAPYMYRYDGVDAALAAARLAEETGLWRAVNDFRWLKASPSPNWSVLPEEDRHAVSL